MSNLRLPPVDSFDAADKFIGTARNRRVFGYKTVGRRVFLPDEADTPEYDIAVRYHDTNIVTYHGDGSITLDTGGWETVTTTNRMDMLTPTRFRVRRRNSYVEVVDALDDAVFRFDTTTRHTIRPSA